MIDLRHPLAVLASRMPWQQTDRGVGGDLFSRKGRVGVAVASNAGRPRVPLRVMIALLYLKHAFNGSDEGGALGRHAPQAVLLRLRV